VIMLLTIYLLLTSLLFIPYAVIILLYRKWFIKLKLFRVDSTLQPQTTFSIIIPARNEENNITTCIQSILQQHYPSSLFEIIIIDDHSTDNTSKLVQNFQLTHPNIQLIQLADELDGKALNSYKKKAIEKAIGYSKHDWIITTDADCMVTNSWLASFDTMIQQRQPVLIAAPVVYTNNGSILSIFQYIDFISLQGITAASVSAGFHSMCNGANLAYQKEAFYHVKGFKGIDNIASGDDMLLMNKIKASYPSKIAFLFSKEAIVTTHPMPTWYSFFNQRIRWASKADSFRDKNIFWVLVLVYCYNLLLFIMPFMAILYWPFIFYWLFFIASKTLVELTFAIPVGRFFGQSFIWWFPFLQPMHIAYTVIAGWLGKFGKYEWKGRSVK